MATAKDLPTKEVLGDKFADVLRGWLSHRQFKRMQRLNRAEPRTPHKICHSHDFCDANMAMLEAFESHGIPSERVCGEDEAVQSLWNDAWDYAFTTHLS